MHAHYQKSNTCTHSLSYTASHLVLVDKGGQLALVIEVLEVPWLAILADERVDDVGVVLELLLLQHESDEP